MKSLTAVVFLLCSLCGATLAFTLPSRQIITTTTRPGVTNRLARQPVDPRMPPATLRCPPHKQSIGSSLGMSLLMSDSAVNSSMFLVRIVFLRAMAFVHFVAFLVAYKQNKALIGDDGITPAKNVLDRAEERGKQKRKTREEWRKSPASKKTTKYTQTMALISNVTQFVIDENPKLARLQNVTKQYAEDIREKLWDRSDGLNRPVTTLLWLAKDRKQLNPFLDDIAIAGLAISSLIFLFGAANVPLVFGLWLCQRSLMSVGGPFYGFGWEPQLNELSFHAMFLVPLLSLQQIPHLPVSPIVAWTIRWMLFRIMLGAGLIKFRGGDRKWVDSTAMYYFYETQPLPNPLSRYFHWMPFLWHRAEVWINHFVECVAPWLLIIPGLPAPLRRAGGILQIAFQTTLIASGNLSFLNWLTIVPAIMCFDDTLVGGLFSASMNTRAMGASWAYQIPLFRRVLNYALLGLVGWLSIPVVKNLLSKNQVMNSSFDPLRLINTYGAFGTVNEDREEFVISAAPSFEGPWKEYEFKVKPGDVNRHPRWISPYHYRLDWQMWIAATCRTIDRSPWLYKFLLKLLERNENAMKLLQNDPWKEHAAKPKYIRVDRYRYLFHRSTGKGDRAYWDREFVGRVYPRQGLATLDSLRDDIKRH